MNDQLYSSLGIDKNGDLQAIEDALEEKQFEYLQRLETVSDSNRKEEIENLLKLIDEEISSVKEKKKNLSSSLILDDSNEDTQALKKAEAKAREEAEKKAKEEAERKAKEEAERKERLAKQVELMKQKEAEKKAKEEERKAKEAEKAAEQAKAQAQAQAAAQNGTNTATGTANTSGAATAPKAANPAAANAPAPVATRKVSDNSPEMANAINSYYLRDYITAFKTFKEMSEKGNPSAQYYLGVLYRNGLGVSKDEERATFWYKKSADGGELAGLAECGEKYINSSDAKEVETAFKYLKQAGDKDDDNSMANYIKACLMGKGGSKELVKAMDFCDKLAAKTDDSYNKKKYGDIKNQLKELKKNSGNKPSPTSGKPPVTPVKVTTLKIKPPRKKKSFLKRLIIAIILCLIMEYGVAYFADKQAEREQDQGTRTEQNVNKKDKNQDVADADKNQEDNNEKEQFVRIASQKTVNIRAGVGTDFDVIGTAQPEAVYAATGSAEQASNGTTWYEIYLDDTHTSTGWVSGSYAVLTE